MSAWSNNDNNNSKPKFSTERQVREVIQLTLYNSAPAGQNTVNIAYNDGAQNNVANIGVATGQFIYFYPNGFGAPGGIAYGNGVPGMFASNNYVISISGNTVTLNVNIGVTQAAGVGVEFDKSIVYNTNKTAWANTNKDTILVTQTRAANLAAGYGVGGGVSNSAYSMGNFNVGWNRIIKKTNNDGTVRYLKETLVALASPTAANTQSGNTSWGQAFTGL